MNRIVSLAAVLVSIVSVACAPQEEDGSEASASDKAQGLDLAAPTPAPLVITCVTNSGDHQVTEEQCKKLLSIAGCKPGAVVGDKMKCSTTSNQREENFDITAPAPEPVLITCITNTGEHQVTEEQCKKLLTIAGCKPGAVLGDKMKCSTASTDPAVDPIDDFTAPPEERTPVTCVTNAGEYVVTVDQCKKLLAIAGCRPGAVVGDKMKCSTT